MPLGLIHMGRLSGGDQRFPQQRAGLGKQAVHLCLVILYPVAAILGIDGDAGGIGRRRQRHRPAPPSLRQGIFPGE